MMKSTRLSDYEILDIVGEGSFACVSKVKFKPTGQIYAWKELYYGGMSDKEKQMLVDEVNILRELTHPNIVKYYDRIIDHEKKKVYIIQEHCDAGDLDMLIKDFRRSKKKIPEDFIWAVLSQTASALQACHQKATGRRVLHRDLKPSNIFLSSLDGRPKKFKLTGLSVKLGDFGLARVLHDQGFAETHVGTPYYMSPEQIQFKSYDEKSDIWSLGCILYEMATLKPPFRASRYTELAKKILRGEYKHFGNISKELANLISCMLKVDRLERPTITRIWKLPKVQLISKTLLVERRYRDVKKREGVQRKKEDQLTKMKAKLKLEHTLLKEKKRRLQDKALDLERQQDRLNKIIRYLRSHSKSNGIAMSPYPNFFQVLDKTSPRSSEEYTLDTPTPDTPTLSTLGSSKWFAEATGGVVLTENDDHNSKSSFDFESSSTTRSRSFSNMCRSSPENID